MADIDLLNIYSAMARHAAHRHEVIARNIANADTPGFKAQEVQGFAEYFDALQKSGLQAAQSAPKVNTVQTSGTMSPNGNTVSLEEQMLQSADAKAQHETALAVYKKTMDLFRISLGKGVR